MNLLGSTHAKEGDGKGVLRAAMEAFVLPPAWHPWAPAGAMQKVSMEAVWAV